VRLPVSPESPKVRQNPAPDNLKSTDFTLPYLYQISHLPVKKNHWMTEMPGHCDFVLQASPTESPRVALRGVLRAQNGRFHLRGVSWGLFFVIAIRICSDQGIGQALWLDNRATLSRTDQISFTLRRTVSHAVCVGHLAPEWTIYSRPTQWPRRAHSWEPTPPLSRESRGKASINLVPADPFQPFELLL